MSADQNYFILFNAFNETLKKSEEPSAAREFFLDNEYLSDLQFILGLDENEIFYGNLIICFVSDNFYRILCLFLGHKLFFVSSSSFFHEKLWNTKGPVRIKMKQISKKTFKEIARFVYTDQIHLTEENMHEILEAARKLKMNYLIDLTMKFIEKNNEQEEICINFNNALNLSDNFESDDPKNFNRSIWLEKKLKDLNEAAEETETSDGQLWKTNGQKNRNFNQSLNLNDVKQQTKPKKLGDRSRTALRSSNQRMKTAEIIGVPELMKFKEATLRLFTTDNQIALKEIHFCSNLSQTDKEFEIRVTHFASGLQTDLFYKKVSLEGAEASSGMTKFALNQKCMLFGNNRKFVITITFKDEKLRHVINHSVFQGTELRVCPYKLQGRYAQIIQKIIYT
jgi:hypothetical protein